MRSLFVSLSSYRSSAHGIHLYQQSCDVLLDLIAEHARPFLVIAGVNFRALDWSEKANRNLARLAQAQGVANHAIGADDEIVIAREDLRGLLFGVLHWNFSCWDTAQIPHRLSLARQSARVMDTARSIRDEPILHLIDGARLFVKSHDDASLAVQAYGPALVRAVLARVLETLVRNMLDSSLLPAQKHDSIAALPDDVLDYFWDTFHSFSIVAADVPAKPGRVRLTFAAVTKDGGTGEPSGYLDYDPNVGRWRHRYR